MICAIVLAAGRSERMGTQKLLLPLGGKPVIAHVLDELLQSCVEQVLVVIGADGARLREALIGRSVQFVGNPDPVSDMFDSVRCGLRALPSDCEAVFVVLGDQPGITHSLVNELIGGFRGGELKIIVPVSEGHRGHPVLFSSNYFEEMLKSHNGDGLRGFLDEHADEVLKIAVSDTTTLEDMDIPADYQRQKKVFENRYADTA